MPIWGSRWPSDPLTARTRGPCSCRPVGGQAAHFTSQSSGRDAEQTEIGRLLYQHLEATKAQQRGRTAKRNVLDTRAALLDAVAQPPILAGGGDLVGFVISVDEFIQRISDLADHKPDAM
ncbi:MAG TPA: hypothetical protein VGK36_13950 [Candidatus Angelobacter sp.]